jgi:opacity protein-like surface antigen
MTCVSRALALLFLVLLMAPSARPLLAQAAPQAEDEARIQAATEAAQAGIRLFKLKNYRDALDIFLKSYQVHPLPVVVWNIARCHEELGDYVQAVRFFEESARTDPDEAGRVEAERRAAALRARQLGTVYLETNPAGAKAVLDGAEAGLTPLSGLWLARGRHELALTLEGHARLTRTLQVVPGQDNHFQFQLEALPGSLVLAAPQPVAGVHVLVDGQEAGPLDLPGSIELVAGAHRVQVSGVAGCQDVDRMVEIGPGGSTLVTMEPAAALAPALTPLTPATPRAAARVTPAEEPAPRPAAPPEPADERGWWYAGFNLGSALVGGLSWRAANGDGESSSLSGMFTGSGDAVRLVFQLYGGFALLDELLLGAELSILNEKGTAKAHSNLGGTLSVGRESLKLGLGGLNLVATWFPWVRGPFFKGGVGFVTAAWKDTKSFADSSLDVEVNNWNSTGWQVVLGAGYAFRLWSGLHLVASSDLQKQFYGGGTAGKDFTGSWLWTLTGGLAWY